MNSQIAKKITILLVSFLLLLFAVFIVREQSVTVYLNGKSELLNTKSIFVWQLLNELNLNTDDGDDLNLSKWDYVENELELIINQQRKIVLHDGVTIIELLSTSNIPADWLSIANIHISAHDDVKIQGELIDSTIPLPYNTILHIDIIRAKSFTLIDNGIQKVLFSTSSTIDGALAEHDIDIHPSDTTNFAPKNPIQDNMELQIFRAKEYTIHIGSEQLKVLSTGDTIAQILLDGNVALIGKDYSVPAVNSTITDTSKINIYRIREEIITEDVLIPFRTIYQPDNTIPLDNLSVVDTGEYGIQKIYTTNTYENDELISSIESDSITIRDSSARTVNYGTQINIQQTVTPDGPITYWRSIQATATSYSPCNLGVNYCNNLTYSGKELKKGMIAVIRSWYKYMNGMTVYITGYGFATIEDIGGGLSGRHWVDLGYTDEDFVSVLRTVTVYFLTPVPPEPNIMWVLD